MEDKIEIIAVSSKLDSDKIIELAKLHRFQIFDMDSVMSKFQLKLAYFHAEEAFKEGRNICKDFMLEFLVRASGKRQIKEAIKEVGIKNPKRIIVAFNKDDSNLSKKKILQILDAKEIDWKEKDDSEIINKMVELEIER